MCLVSTAGQSQCLPHGHNDSAVCVFCRQTSVECFLAVVSYADFEPTESSSVFLIL